MAAPKTRRISDVGNLVKEQLLGQGTFGQVWRIHHKVTQETSVLKEIKVGTEKQTRMATNEGLLLGLGSNSLLTLPRCVAEVLSTLHHPSIIQSVALSVARARGSPDTLQALRVLCGSNHSVSHHGAGGRRRCAAAHQGCAGRTEGFFFFFSFFVSFFFSFPPVFNP